MHINKGNMKETSSMFHLNKQNIVILDQRLAQSANVLDAQGNVFTTQKNSRNDNKHKSCLFYQESTVQIVSKFFSTIQLWLKRM